MSKRIIALAVLGAAFFAGSANATTWTYDGIITDCNAAICGLVPIFTGDPVSGSIDIDVGVSDSFMLDTSATGAGGLLDLINFAFLVGGVIPVEPVGPNPCTPGVDCAGVIISGSGTTDAAGDFDSGILMGSFVGGTLGGLLGAVVIDLVTGDFLVTVGGGSVFVADVQGSFSRVVPVPAAVWLMGSAIMGLVGLRRRKTA